MLEENETGPHRCGESLSQDFHWLQIGISTLASWINSQNQRKSARIGRKKSSSFSVRKKSRQPSPPSLGCYRHHNTQETPGEEGGSRTAPSSRRRPQIEAVINHASAEWNRTTAIAPYRVLCWSSTTVVLSMSPGI